MDYLARRDHSEKELREKLGRNFTPQEIQEAVEYATEHGWMTAPEELSERVALRLHEKYRGHLYICQYLRQKGLPLVDKDDDIEYKKALEWANLKWSSCEDKGKIAQSLSRRGFESAIIRKVLYGK